MKRLNIRTGLLFGMVILSIEFFSNAWASNLTSGTCGTSCTWSLVDIDGGKELIIEGSGDMKDYRHNAGTGLEVPWYASRSQIVSVKIAEGITSIGDTALLGTRITDVSIPTSVSKIGVAAFYEIPTLTQVVIPENITSIGQNAFWSSPVNTIYCTSAQKQSGGACNNLAYKAFYGTVLEYIKDENDIIVYENDNKTVKGIYSKYSDIVSDNVVNLHDSVNSATGMIDRYDGRGNYINSYKKDPDGSVSIYDGNGKLIGVKGKRILTVDEATALVSGSGKNTFILKYR